MLADRTLNPPRESNLDFRFRCKVAADSEYFGILFYYQKILTGRESRGRVREMIWESASNYWRPIVSLPKERQRALDSAIFCIHKIERKIGQLKDDGAGSFESGNRVEIQRPSELIFQFTTRISGNHPADIELGRYLRGAEDFSPFEKIVWSSDSFYGVTAYRELGIYDSAQIQEKAEKCIEELEKHRELLYRLFPEIRPSLKGEIIETGRAADRSHECARGREKPDDTDWSESLSIGNQLL